MLQQELGTHIAMQLQKQLFEDSPITFNQSVNLSKVIKTYPSLTILNTLLITAHFLLCILFVWGNKIFSNISKTCWCVNKCFPIYLKLTYRVHLQWLPVIFSITLERGKLERHEKLQRTTNKIFLENEQHSQIWSGISSVSLTNNVWAFNSRVTSNKLS